MEIYENYNVVVCISNYVESHVTVYEHKKYGFKIFSKHLWFRKIPLKMLKLPSYFNKLTIFCSNIIYGRSHFPSSIFMPTEKRLKFVYLFYSSFTGSDCQHDRKLKSIVKTFMIFIYEIFMRWIGSVDSKEASKTQNVEFVLSSVHPRLPTCGILFFFGFGVYL